MEDSGRGTMRGCGDRSGDSMRERSSKVFRGFEGDIEASGVRRGVRGIVEVSECTVYVRGGLRIVSPRWCESGRGGGDVDGV
jgi:hypothetical protein